MPSELLYILVGCLLGCARGISSDSSFLDVNTGGVCKDDGEAWPYDSMNGFLLCWRGDVSITVYDEESSNAAGCDVGTFLSKSDVKDMSKQEKKEQQAKWTTTLLTEGRAMWVPFGCVTSAVPLASNRDSKSEAGVAVKSKKPGRSGKKDESEYVVLVFIPVLGDKDAEKPRKTVCQVMGRWTSNREHGPHRWEQDSDWKEYCKSLESIVKQTSKKADDDGDDE